MVWGVRCPPRDGNDLLLASYSFSLSSDSECWSQMLMFASSVLYLGGKPRKEETILSGIYNPPPFPFSLAFDLCSCSAGSVSEAAPCCWGCWAGLLFQHWGDGCGAASVTPAHGAAMCEVLHEVPDAWQTCRLRPIDLHWPGCCSASAFLMSFSSNDCILGPCKKTHKTWRSRFQHLRMALIS